MAKIEVYRVKDGVKVWVPEHWMEHSELKKPFRKTPQTKAADNSANTSSDSAASASTTRNTTAASSGK